MFYVAIAAALGLVVLAIVQDCRFMSALKVTQADLFHE